jgi:tetratricopeptide (TPR) repeat protein
MLKRFLAFLVLAALLLGIGGLFYLNPAVVEFHVTPTRRVSLPLPLLLLASFFAGACAIFVLALTREAQWTLADRRRRKSEAAAAKARALSATGRDLLWHGRPELATRVLRRTPTDARDAESLAVLAETALSADRYDEARMIVEDSLALHPDHPRLLALLATVSARQSEWRTATNLLERAVGVEPASPRLAAALRDAYVRERRWAEAVRAEVNYLALVRSPDQIVAERARLLGLRYELALDRASADDRIKELYGLLWGAPAFLPAAISLGDALQPLGRLREAGRVWLRAARLRPAPVLLARLESLYRELGRPKKMVALYRRLRRRSDSPVLLRRLVRFLLAEGALEEAAAELATASPKVAEDFETQLLRGEVERVRGNAELALKAFRTAYDSASTDQVSYLCSACGRRNPDWEPRCLGCGAWDSLGAHPSADLA